MSDNHNSDNNLPRKFKCLICDATDATELVIGHDGLLYSFCYVCRNPIRVTRQTILSP